MPVKGEKNEEESQDDAMPSRDTGQCLYCSGRFDNLSEHQAVCLSKMDYEKRIREEHMDAATAPATGDEKPGAIRRSPAGLPEKIPYGLPWLLARIDDYEAADAAGKEELKEKGLAYWWVEFMPPPGVSPQATWNGIKWMFKPGETQKAPNVHVSVLLKSYEKTIHAFDIGVDPAHARPGDLVHAPGISTDLGDVMKEVANQ